MDFAAAYDTVLDHWPESTESIMVATRYGSTHVIASGPAGGRPLVLLHGGGATAAVWGLVVCGLTGRRVYAVEQLGEPGRSVADGVRPRSFDDLTAWLVQVLDGIGLAGTDLCGHSNGGCVAAHFALAEPNRVERLVLLDPTRVFAGMRPGYLAHALPLLRPNATRLRRFLTWETGGLPVDPDWLRLAECGADSFPATRPVVAKLPAPQRLRGLTAPTLVVLAGRGRAHRRGVVAAGAQANLPDVRVEVLAGATHHSLPTYPAAEVTRLLVTFTG